MSAFQGGMRWCCFPPLSRVRDLRCLNWSWTPCADIGGPAMPVCSQRRWPFSGSELATWLSALLSPGWLSTLLRRPASDVSQYPQARSSPQRYDRSRLQLSRAASLATRWVSLSSRGAAQELQRKRKRHCQLLVVRSTTAAGVSPQRIDKALGQMSRRGDRQPQAGSSSKYISWPAVHH